MLSPPLVSVIIPTYNYGRFLPETLCSLQAQSFLHWEAVVVDDGSTDDTATVVAALARTEPRLRYLQQPNRGQAAARNAGLSASEGAYVQFLDADDLLEPEKLSFQVRLLEQSSHADLVYGSARFFPDGRPEEQWHSIDLTAVPWMPEVSGSGPAVLLPLVQANVMVVSSPLVRRRAVQAVGPFDETLPPLEDWDYWLRCAALGMRFEYADAAATRALVRVHPGSSSANPRRMAEATLRLRRKHAATLRDPEARERNRVLLADIEAWLAQIREFEAAVRARVPPGDRFLLVDEDQLRGELAADFRAVPFLEREGEYWGPPPDDEVAVRELERLRNTGAAWAVFAWPAFWWFDHYPGLARHLHSNYRCSLRNERLVAFDLSS